MLGTPRRFGAEMLKISGSQLSALSVSAWKSYERRASDELLNIFPGKARYLGGFGVRKVVRAGIDRACRYGIKNQDEVFLYTALMLVLGGGFDEDPLIPWASAILKSPSSGGIKMKHLYKASTVYVDAVSGKGGVFLSNALVKLCHAQYGDFHDMDALGDIDASGGSADSVVRGLSYFYPEKFSFVGPDVLVRWCHEKLLEANQMGFRTHADCFLYVLSMFFWGSVFSSDPRFEALVRDMTSNMDVLSVMKRYAQTVLEDMTP
jgi:hypothetical protein